MDNRLRDPAKSWTWRVLGNGGSRYDLIISLLNIESADGFEPMTANCKTCGPTYGVACSRGGAASFRTVLHGFTSF